MNNVIAFKRKRPPPVAVPDIVTSMVMMWCDSISLMQVATLSMFTCYLDDR